MINPKYDKQIKQWIEENRDKIMNEWIEISKIPAIKGEAEENAPFGKECAKALNECADLFKRHGFETKVYNQSGYALSSLGSGKKTIGLFGHSDVVPVGDDWLYTKPFEPSIKDGTLSGRGVWDNKSGIMAALCAMEIIRSYDIPIRSIRRNTYHTTFLRKNSERNFALSLSFRGVLSNSTLIFFLDSLVTLGLLSTF